MRTSITALQRRKGAADATPITMVTAYDYTSARLVDSSDVDAILVGDSLGMVMMGHESTLPVTLDEMIHHARAVRRGSERALLVVDVPFLSSTAEEPLIAAATRILAETGAQSVKVEGGAHRTATVRRLVESGIPVMGHLGFTPQSVNTLGTRVQAREESTARQLIADALALQAAGAWAVVLELVPSELAAEVTRRLDILTIGIGAGPECDGQVQVWHDMLGLYEEFEPKHTRRFRTLGEEVRGALNEYVAEVAAGTFPAEANGSRMDPEVLARAVSSEAAPER